MATMQKRRSAKGIRYKVTVRIKGYPSQTKTFKKKSEAREWEVKKEAEIRAFLKNKDLPLIEQQVKTRMKLSELIELHKGNRSGLLQKCKEKICKM